jgi:hypothetical protein
MQQQQQQQVVVVVGQLGQGLESRQWVQQLHLVELLMCLVVVVVVA